MTDTQFSHVLHTRNLWLAIAGASATVVGTMLVYAALAVHDVIARGQWTLVYTLLLATLLSNLTTWLCATARRTDLYTIAAGNSLTQLRRYRGEIDNVIEALEEEATA